MSRNIEVVEACGQSVEEMPVEIVERKGVGHPDSLCDGIAEQISRQYTLWCDANLGRRLHHNFDKVQLVAGEAEIDFGKGRILKPILIQIAGRAIAECDGRRIPLDEIAEGTARAYLEETLRNLDPREHVKIKSYAGRGDPTLIRTVEKVTANDTSFGCSHWPLSGLERVVLETCEHINGDLIDRFPIGEDVKVMGLKRGGGVSLTCAVPFLAPEVRSRKAYESGKAQLREAILKFARGVEERTEEVALNCADRHEPENEVFLTLTGTGAERSDDGAVGRGNRVNGLITPFRSVSLEAAAGKNPISHVGKIYNVMALQIAKRIVEGVNEVREASVYILSRIGSPLGEPLVASATVRTQEGGIPRAVEEKVRFIVEEAFARVEGVTELFLERTVRLF